MDKLLVIEFIRLTPIVRESVFAFDISSLCFSLSVF